MLLVEFRPSREFGLVLGLDSLFAVPPCAAAVEIVSDVGSASNGHGQSIAQIF